MLSATEPLPLAIDYDDESLAETIDAIAALLLDAAAASHREVAA